MEIMTTKRYGDEDVEMLWRLESRNAMEMRTTKCCEDEDDEML